MNKEEKKEEGRQKLKGDSGGVEGLRMGNRERMRKDSEGRDGTLRRGHTHIFGEGEDARE